MFLKDKNNFAVGSADKLITARTINGTSFNGTANITTANWGTARNITIGNTTKSVNGSGNVAWNLSEIGAAAASHTHNSITNQDTRNVNTTPTQMPLGLSVHLKSNSTDGLNDGGTYHSTLMIKGWNDVSGGPWGQVAVTANNNLYFRSSNSDTWNAWKKVSLDGHTHSYLPLGGGTLSGKLVMTQNSEAIVADSPMQMGYEYLACYGNLRLYADTDGTSGANGEYVHIATGSHQPSLNSGLTVYRDYATCNNVQFTSNGDIVLNNNKAIYGKATDGASRLMLRMTGSNIVDVGNPSSQTVLLGPVNPTWWNGSEGLTLAHNKTKLFEGSNYKFGQGLYGTSDAGVASTTSAVSVQGISAWIKRNNYYAGDGDRFINASASATQLFLDGGSHKAQVRWSTNTPTVDGRITWSAAEKIVSSVYNVTIHDSAPSSPGWGDVWIQI